MMQSFFNYLPQIIFFLYTILAIYRSKKVFEKEKKNDSQYSDGISDGMMLAILWIAWLYWIIQGNF